jgi:hypothetical protein
LIENVLAAFEMDEIIYVMRDHILGTVDCYSNMADLIRSECWEMGLYICLYQKI